MKIDREKLLTELEMVKAGLSPREFIEQSSCYVFQEGQVMTYNDEIACRKEVDVHITGAVQADKLIAVLQKLEDPDLTVRTNDRGELEFRGRSKGFGIAMDPEIYLPIDRVEVPSKWHPLSKDFTEAVGLVLGCVSKDESRFTLTCVHVHPEYVEACDNLQAMRVRVKTRIKQPMLIRGVSLGHIMGLGMDQVAMTSGWIHFKNHDGLLFSCRRYVEEYPKLDEVLAVIKGHPITLPKGVVGASDRAAIFAKDDTGDPLLLVSLKEGVVRITGQGVAGWYKEAKKAVYEGPPIRFRITSETLKHITEKYSEAQVQENKLKATGGNWEYVAFLSGEERADGDAE